MLVIFAWKDMAEPTETPENWGWTYDDAHTMCDFMSLYECFEDPTENLLIAAVWASKNVNEVGMQQKGIRLVTTTVSGKPCSGRVGKWIKKIEKRDGFLPPH